MSAEGDVERDGTLESSDSSLSVWDLMAGRLGMRKECLLSCFLAKLADEKLDSGIWGT